MRCDQRLIAALAFASIAAVTAEPLKAQSGGPVIALDSVGVIATFGMRDAASRQEVLAKPLDARFSRNTVVILDAAEPWVRVFDRDGNLLRRMSRIGEGPGETPRPFSVSGTVEGGVLLSHALGIERFDAEGRHLSSIRGLRASGAIEACGGLLTLIEPSSGRPLTTTLVRTDLQGVVLDTVMRASPVRGRNRNYYPWAIQRTSNGVALWPEEEGRHRLLELGCDGELRREVALPALGRGDSIVIEGGRMGIMSPRSPYPAGLVRVQGRLLWAARTLIERSGDRADSVTTVSVFDAAGRGRQVSIRGWYQLFDAAPDGGILIGNSWTLGQNWRYGATWGLPPGVLLVDGNTLLRIIDARGTPIPPRER
jgi:hypothetical protein